MEHDKNLRGLFMYAIITAIHIITSFLIIVVVLLQSGKGAGLSGIFGGAGEQLFSTPSSGSFLRKVTLTLAIVFAVTSISLTVMASRRHYQSVTTIQQR